MDRISREHRSWNMSRITAKNTGPEVLIRSILYKAGYRYRLNVAKLPGSPDIILPKYNSAIFVNGCFWHRHSGCKYCYTPKTRQEFWTNKFKQTVARDRKKRDDLKALGWRVITVWECETNNLEGLKRKLLSFLN